MAAKNRFVLISCIEIEGIQKIMQLHKTAAKSRYRLTVLNPVIQQAKNFCLCNVVFNNVVSCCSIDFTKPSSLSCPIQCVRTNN